MTTDFNETKALRREVLDTFVRRTMGLNEHFELKQIERTKRSYLLTYAVQPNWRVVYQARRKWLRENIPALAAVDMPHLRAPLPSSQNAKEGS